MSLSIRCFQTLWGFNGTADDAASQAKRLAYDGIEGPLPTPIDQRQAFAETLNEHGLAYICEIATTGSYVPDRSLTAKDHLDDLQGKLDQLVETPDLNTQFVTCLGGCDAWDFWESAFFFQEAMGLAKTYGIDISFETHRGRSFFNPWATRNLLHHLPDIKLTFDLSHWCAVCEGLQAEDEVLIRKLAPHAHHIHGRVGYDQGPQVPDPRQGVYQHELARHTQWWEWLWRAQAKSGYGITTFTPEFGPDGYQYRTLDGEQDLVDLTRINVFMADHIRQWFNQHDYPTEVLKN